jgi:hypothetical protein
MRTNTRNACVRALAIGLCATWLGSRPAQAMELAKEVQLRRAMDKLWQDHVTWTRLLIVSTVAHLPDTQAATDRLLKNQDDIGNAIKPFYGAAAGDQLTRLLKEHILEAAEVVNAAAAHDKAKLDDANKRWRANANQIAAFLSTANPNWPLPEMQGMMNQHLDLTTLEAISRINRDWRADVEAYDRVRAEILEMSDMLASGIIQQFPQEFARRAASAH